ncbi:MAG: PAS domain S-box protein [Acidobacteriota bacterium]
MGNMTTAPAPQNVAEGRDIVAGSPDPLLADHGYLLSTLLDRVPSGIYFKDLASRFVLINRQQARTLGLQCSGDAVGKSDLDFFAEEHAKEALLDEQAIIDSGCALVNKEEKETWPDGRVTWVSTSKMPLRSPDGRIIGTFGLSSDVTESRQVRQALEESEARFQELIGAIREVFWIAEAGSGRILYVSPAYEAIWGKSCAELYANPWQWVASAGEEYRPQLVNLYAQEHREAFEAAFTICRPDGEVRWIRHRGFPIFGEQGNVIRIAGISADITEARLANRAHTRNQRLLASILNSSQDAIFSESLDGTIISWNPAAETVLGYAASEIIGASGDVLSGSDKSEERAWIAEHTRRGIAVPYFNTDRRHRDGRIIPVSLTAFPVRDETGTIIGVSTIAHDRSARKELEEKLLSVESQLRALLETTGESVLVLDHDWRITYINRVRPGETADAVLGQKLWEYDAELVGSIFEQEYRAAMLGRELRRFEGYLATSKRWLACTAYPSGSGLLVLAQDVTEKHAMDEQLRNAQKMEAIGQLAAGIAHEINTPIQYVGDNTLFLKETWDQVSDILELTQKLIRDSAPAPGGNRTWSELAACIKSADLNYLNEEVPRAIEQALEGVGRVARIVRAMKEFSHPGSEEMRAIDLNKAIEATVTIARNEWKYVAEVNLSLDPTLPMVVCFAGEINQVLLNLLVNAAHAVAEARQAGRPERGQIGITTVYDGDWVEVRIQDSGTGIPEEIREKVFDPFFTTKEVGKGTGQGLTLAQTVVVKKHSGRIWFETESGKGTTFFIRLPIAGAVEEPR